MCLDWKQIQSWAKVSHFFQCGLLSFSRMRTISQFQFPSLRRNHNLSFQFSRNSLPSIFPNRRFLNRNVVNFYNSQLCHSSYANGGSTQASKISMNLRRKMSSPFPLPGTSILWIFADFKRFITPHCKLRGEETWL